MLFHIRRPKACSSKSSGQVKSYSYALDGVDLNNGHETLVVFKHTQLAAVASLFFARWLQAPVSRRVLLTRLLSLYGVDTTYDVSMLLSAGWHHDPRFHELLADAAVSKRHAFPQQIKNYLHA